MASLGQFGTGGSKSAMKSRWSIEGTAGLDFQQWPTSHKPGFGCLSVSQGSGECEPMNFSGWLYMITFVFTPWLKFFSCPFTVGGDSECIFWKTVCPHTVSPGWVGLWVSWQEGGGGGGGGRKPNFHNSSCQMYGCKKSHALVGTNGSDRPCAASTAGWGSPHPALNQTEGKAVKTCTLFLSRWRPVSYPQQRTNVQQWGHSQPQRWLNDLSLSLAFNYFIFL